MKAVSGLWSVVSCDQRFSAVAADGFEIAVQFWSQFIHQWLERLNIRLIEETPAIGAAQKVFRFVQGTPSSTHEPFVIRITPSPIALRDVRSHAVGGADHLHPDGDSRKVIPFNNQSPDAIGNLF